MINSKTMAEYKDLDINMALGLLYDLNRVTIGCRRAYPFTNENQRGVFSHLDVKGKRVATVGSSGDQLLNAVYYGASEVTLIDGNEFAIPVALFKIASVKNLSLAELEEYWTKENILSPKYYSKISHDILDPQARMFWDDIMLNGAYSEKFVDQLFNINFKSSNFYRGTISSMVLSEAFENEDTLSVLKENLKNCKLNYVCADFKDFPDVLDGKYDAILLSNVKDYVHDSKTYYDTILRLRDERLAKGGRMQIQYAFNSHDNGENSHVPGVEDECIHEYVIQRASNIRWETRGTDYENAEARLINAQNSEDDKEIKELLWRNSMPNLTSKVIFMDK